MPNFDAGSITSDLQFDLSGIESAITRLRNQTRRFNQDSRAAFERSQRSVTNFTNRIRRASTVIGGFARRLASVRTALIGLGSAALGGFGALRFTQFTGEVDAAERSFTNLVESIGGEAPRALQTLRAATRNTISDLDLFRQTNVAAQLGVATSVDEFAELAAAARRLGQAVGRSANESLDDLVRGIGRQSPLILDNLGITVRASQAYEDYARSIGVAASSLSDSQRRNAFFAASLDAVQVALERLGPDTLSINDLINQFTASLSNLLTQISRNVTPAIRQLLETINEFNFENLARVIGGSLTQNIRAFTEILENGSFVETLERVAATLGSVTQIFLSLTRGLQEQVDLFFSGPEGAGRVVGGLIDSIQSAILNLASGIGQLFLSGITFLVTNAQSTLVPFFRALGSTIAEGFIESLRSLGADIAQVFDRIFRRFFPDGETELARLNLQNARTDLAAFRQTNQGQLTRDQQLELRDIQTEILRREERLEELLNPVASAMEGSAEAQQSLSRELAQSGFSRAAEGLGDLVGALSGRSGNDLRQTVVDFFERLGAFTNAAPFSNAREPGFGGQFFDVPPAAGEGLNLQIDTFLDIFRRFNTAVQAQARSGILSFGTQAFDSATNTIQEVRQRIREEREERERNERQLAEQQRERQLQLAGDFSREIGFGLIQAIRNGEDALTALANVFSRELEAQLGDVLDNLGQAVASNFDPGTGAFLGSLTALAGTAALSAFTDRDSSFREANVDDIVSGGNVIRGVVAGPQTVAIGELGASIAEANRGVENRLDQLIELKIFEINSATLGAAGVGSAGSI